MNRASLLSGEIGRAAATMWWVALGFLFTYAALDAYAQWGHTSSVLTKFGVVHGSGAITIPIAFVGFGAVSFTTAYLSWKKRHSNE